MTRHVLNRMALAAGLSAIMAFSTSSATSARPQRDQGRQEDDGQDQGRDKRDAKRDKQDEKQDRKDAKQDERDRHQAPGQQKKADRRDEQERQALIRQHEQRLSQYRETLDRQQRAAQEQEAQLQQQRRQAQFAYQRQYLEGLREQQSRLQQQQRYDYDHDPFFSTPSQYRYTREGRRFDTNQYGLDLLRQAVNNGYDQGFRAGQADRSDHWRSDYQGSYAYQDANYGYGGFYVEREDYNYYFREGFRRGYEDGYGNSHRYGAVSNGKAAIHPDVLGGIITYESIR